ncbi:MAG: hypothetical protein KatS3mg085_750 [Candidatus Dojkabacteria bacterium]|nr:MAG: hypothetical protein KatS3mg085_750 [Candidatus Dojkabacteria bacterium]
MKKRNFKPDPIEFLGDISTINEENILTTVLHGSFLYERKDELPDVSYVDTRVYFKNKFQKSTFTKLEIRPDVDVLIISSDKNICKKNIESYISENNIKEKMNYCMTINIVDIDTAKREVARKGTSAIKTILTISPHSFIYKNSEADDLINYTENFVTDEDKALLTEYFLRKEYIRKHARLKEEEFQIDRDKYLEKYPLLLSYYEGNYYSGFPKYREKIELPKKVVLKQRQDIDKNNFISNAHNI